VAFLRKRARAEKHHQPKGYEACHGYCQDIDGVSVHVVNFVTD
jgi:hypothetical protein